MMAKNKIIVGISAGALVINHTCFVSGDEDYPNEFTMTGLSLKSNFICEVHYDKTRHERIDNIVKENNVIAIEDNSALFYYPTGEIVTIGKVHFFNKPV